MGGWAFEVLAWLTLPLKFSLLRPTLHLPLPASPRVPQVRYDKRVGENTAIKFMTDGILLRCATLLLTTVTLVSRGVWLPAAASVWLPRCCKSWCGLHRCRPLLQFLPHCRAGQADFLLGTCSFTASPCVTALTASGNANCREVQEDFLLRRYSAILVDEAHERSLNTDILCGERAFVQQSPRCLCVLWLRGQACC